MPSPHAIEATDASFPRDVVEESRRRPVVVDFWAPWCGPCRTLGPLLERLAEEHGGAFLLVKVNVDENPRTAASFGVQSIPFVVAFRHGEPVLEFVGAQPESAVRQFLSRLLPDEADRLAEEGARLLADARDAEAEARLRESLERRPGHPRASLELARLLDRRGETAAALDLLDRARSDASTGPEIDRLRAELRLRTEAPADDLPALRAAVASRPEDAAARLALGHALARAGEYDEALAALLEAVRLDRNLEDGAARKAMLDLFTLLGRDDPRVDRYQRELARILYA